MTDVPAARHVLVVGAQCRAMGELSRLDEAARKLHDVMVAPALGGCAERSGEYPSLLLGDDLKPDDVKNAVHKAALVAKESNAVLVIALLGHGFTPTQQTNLYYMVADSTTQSTGSAVEVGPLLADAANALGVDGVIAIIDTCCALGALPDAARLVGGTREGRSRLAVITAASADEPARDMRLSSAVVEVLTGGVMGAGPDLYVDPIFVKALRDLVLGQDIGYLTYDNDPFAMERLWLARNSSHAGSGVDECVGPLGREELEDVVGAWRGERTMPQRLSRSALDELSRFLEEDGEGSGADALWRVRVVEVVEALQECTTTADLLVQTLPELITGELLRSAGRLAGYPVRAVGAALLRDLLEYAALRARPLSGSRWAGTARFLAAVQSCAGSTALDGRLSGWAVQHGALVEFNDALAEFDQARQQDRVRLVISLAGAWTDWPEELDAWLLGGQSPVPLHHSFGCENADRAGVGRAIGEALAWARSQLLSPDMLVNVDVAAPAHLLAQWRPEEEKIGRFLLGAYHSVVMRWSGRMDPAEGSAEINDAARKALKAVAGCWPVPVDWIDSVLLNDRARLEHKLMSGGYPAAVGVDHHPTGLDDALELLLPYIPIVLWPRADAGRDNGRLRELVKESWYTLPHAFTDAYRARWGTHEDCTLCLGDVRAVWHDEAWLEFCRPFENRIVAAIEEEQ